ncbi:MAG: triose-phosphate isomerase [Geminicoccaceae bacterium]|nr:triose-phosphate isomerase [Geminicoccaceae bacterium]MCS7268227.1 triose-phosphate isomerase [Geminicoccaceae bacterium]MDW8125003.1 triose-phosphate isomerase [Geminicoccaceae bacterium]
MRLDRPIVFGNWKMNGLRAEGLALAGALAERAVRLSGTLGIFPPFTILHAVAQRVRETAILVGGQDCHERAFGAFTGCVSAPMLVDAGARAVILGHSERRHGLGETDALVRAKLQAARAAGLLVVLCVGETEEERLAGKCEERLRAQLEGSLPPGIGPEGLVVAYEPVWAIGTGRTPTAQDIGSTHAALRSMLKRCVVGGEEVPILYGGSVKPENAAEIMATEGVDGVLVGGASLDARAFWSIYQAGGGA